MAMSTNQQKRLNELEVYARQQRDKTGYGYPGYDAEEADKWTNVLTWILLIEEDN